MGKKYENPPLVEAIFEVTLTQDTSWDLAVVGLVYERIKEKFPHRESRIVQELNITAGPEGVKQEVRTSERSFFFRSDRRMLVQIGPRLLAVNSLKPYPGWTDFKSNIEEVFNAFCEVVEVKGLEKMALRYINLIEITEDRIEPKDFFKIYIHLGEQFPRELVNYNIECLFPFDGGKNLCRLQLRFPFLQIPTPQIPTQAPRSFLLDIYYTLAQPISVETEEVLKWLEEAHNRIESIFEGSITERLREQFRR